MKRIGRSERFDIKSFKRNEARPVNTIVVRFIGIFNEKENGILSYARAYCPIEGAVNLTTFRTS